MSFIEKDLEFVQTRDQELAIALFKSIKFQLKGSVMVVYLVSIDFCTKFTVRKWRSSIFSRIA